MPYVKCTKMGHQSPGDEPTQAGEEGDNMQSEEEVVRQNLTASKSKQVAAYVDELKTLKGRRKELAGILRYLDKPEERVGAIIIYGSPATDADARIKNIIAKLEEHGTSVTFKQQSLGYTHGTTNRESKK